MRGFKNWNGLGWGEGVFRGLGEIFHDRIFFIIFVFNCIVERKTYMIYFKDLSETGFKSHHQNV